MPGRTGSVAATVAVTGRTTAAAARTVVVADSDELSAAADTPVTGLLDGSAAGAPVLTVGKNEKVALGARMGCPRFVADFHIAVRAGGHAVTSSSASWCAGNGRKISARALTTLFLPHWTA